MASEESYLLGLLRAEMRLIASYKDRRHWAKTSAAAFG